MRLMTTFAICAGLRNDVVVVVKRDADEAFFSGNVATLGVRVDEARLRLLPLSVAKVFSLLVNLACVVAIEDRVEHHFGVVAVGVRPSAEAFRVRQYSSELACKGASRGVFYLGPAQGEPLRRGEVLRAAKL